MNDQPVSDRPMPAGCICQGTGPMITSVISRMAPVEAVKHFRTARVEFLKGLRSLLDRRIEQLSKVRPSEETGASIPID